jgi:hypothetical protein
MKKILTLILVSTFASFAIANTTPVKPAEKMNQTKQVVNDQLFKLQEMDRILDEENLTYDQLAAKYPELLEETPISSSVDEGVFDKAADSPLGIPGFWWGFCLGWVGMLIVYLMMDEGQDRKDQVKNALIGCIIGSVIGLGIYFLAWGTLLWWGDAGQAVSTAITAGC